MNGTLEVVAALAPVIAARSRGDRTRSAGAAGSGGGADGGGLLPDVGAPQPRRRRTRPAGPDAGDRGAGAGRWLGRVDGDDRRRGAGAAREAPAGDLRRHLRRGPRRHPRRHGQPDGRGHAGRRWVSGHRTVVVRQRLPALPLVHRPLHRRRRPPAADTHDGAAPRRRRDQGHLVGVGPVRHRKPRLRRQRRLRAGRTQLRAVGRAVPRRPAVCGYRSCRSPRSGSGPWPSASPTALWARSPTWPPGRCRCSATGRWRRTRCSRISSATPTPGCEPPAPCCTPTPRRRGRQRWPARRSPPTTGPGSGPRPRG